MDFFNSAIDVLQTLVIALGAGLGIWGVINLLEGYGQDNPASKSQGVKQLVAGGGVALIGVTLQLLRPFLHRKGQARPCRRLAGNRPHFPCLLEGKACGWGRRHAPGLHRRADF